MNEAGFWKQIKTGMAGRWHAVRIENACGSGIPDVDYAILNRIQGKIELKYLPEAPKRPDTKVRLPHFNPQQKLFFRMRGPVSGDVWLMVRVADEYFIFDWKTALVIENHTIAEWRVMAKGYWKTQINYTVMAKILIEG